MNTLPTELQSYVGRTHVFPDQNSITIKEIKLRDAGIYWVKYLTQQGAGIPRQHIMIWEEFKNHYGHLFP